MHELVLATGNKGKVAELEGLLQPLGWQVKPQSEWNFAEVEETGLTFIENAILKARHAAELTGLPALADDSGLAVNALDGAPGIYSARYAGLGCTDQENIDKLLAALQDIPDAERQASFHCVLVYMRHANDPTPIVCHGRWDGMIATAQHGDHGFGYDPVFWLPELNCTAAQLSASQKQQLSHRGKALRQLVEQLQASL
ncbi:RdgB/HAM1 family non-canonical purine NTP pyrophosphatase [Pseudidiomarina andamanensis]|uniref:dITP/XTP pyrophosphatase n=1 Tax=Pseudidiomarina andamanensis TaxID=1940690 RepID=A0AA92ILN4_9GAMM|nr:RdgB/HAM1 family non-canonical purine NTP pyrophosphatase [Pseudidiomarina andamanensis]MDS0218790.1 RdgB/HAM1 family non-canonical purine NTP pyrophosphatase [Pseudidiomarina andamanensis]QGT95641.1 RdgB/HAM1 family non-canonical purine NTP pyrophosphatase [Pseudidiomarina andamanensis]